MTTLEDDGARPIAQRPGPPEPPSGTPASPPPRRVLGVPVAWIRRTAVATWVVVLAISVARSGVPIDREAIIVWIATGLLALSIGRRPLWTVAVDWLPFALVLVVYDLTRGAADALNRPTMWTPQLAADRWIGGGVEPTVWLQQHLKDVSPPWWEVAVSCTYVSYFIAPYAVAGVLWLRHRRLWGRFAARFLVISLLGLAVFVLFPAAPPWAASQCTPAQVADHPSEPACLGLLTGRPDGGLLGAFTVTHPGAASHVERVSGRGFEELGLHFATRLLNEGQADVNAVAAIPSLHAAISLLIAVFLWPIVRAWWRLLLVAYPLVMAFSLVYSAEHYVVDILLGWALCAVVCVAMSAGERRWDRRRRKAVGRADNLEFETADRQPDGDPSCPPPRTPLPAATTASSTSASGAASSFPRRRSTAGPVPPGTTARSASS